MAVKKHPSLILISVITNFLVFFILLISINNSAYASCSGYGGTDSACPPPDYITGLAWNISTPQDVGNACANSRMSGRNNYTAICTQENTGNSCSIAFQSGTCTYWGCINGSTCDHTNCQSAPCGFALCPVQGSNSYCGGNPTPTDANTPTPGAPTATATPPPSCTAPGLNCNNFTATTSTNVIVHGSTAPYPSIVIQPGQTLTFNSNIYAGGVNNVYEIPAVYSWGDGNTCQMSYSTSGGISSNIKWCSGGVQKTPIAYPNSGYNMTSDCNGEDPPATQYTLNRNPYCRCTTSDYSGNSQECDTAILNRMTKRQFSSAGSYTVQNTAQASCGHINNNSNPCGINVVVGNPTATPTPAPTNTPVPGVVSGRVINIGLSPTPPINVCTTSPQGTYVNGQTIGLRDTNGNLLRPIITTYQYNGANGGFHFDTVSQGLYDVCLESYLTSTPLKYVCTANYDSGNQFRQCQVINQPAAPGYTSNLRFLYQDPTPTLVPPPAPDVQIPSCISPTPGPVGNPGYMTWEDAVPNPPNARTSWIDINVGSTTFGRYYYHRYVANLGNIAGIPGTPPGAFVQYDSQNGVDTGIYLNLQLDTLYATRAWNGVFSSTVSFTIPSCTALTSTPTPTPTSAATPTPTTAPALWYKIQNTSFYRLSDNINPIPVTVQAYDGDDNGGRYFDNGSGAGLVSSQSIQDYGTAPISIPGYKNINYARTTNTNVADYINYIKSKKEYVTVADPSFSNLQANKINIFNPTNTDLGVSTYTIDSTAATNIKNALINGNIVLIIDGNVQIDADLNKASIGFGNPGSLALLTTGSIQIKSSVTELGGIYIADRFDFSYDAPLTITPLKVTGNIISTGTTAADTKKRKRKDTSQKPSIFLNASPKMYMDLLPYLSVSVYDWNEQTP